MAFQAVNSANAASIVPFSFRLGSGLTVTTLTTFTTESHTVSDPKTSSGNSGSPIP